MQKSVFHKVKWITMSVIAMAVLSACSVGEQGAVTSTRMTDTRAGSDEKKSLSMINWTNYIGKSTIPDFEREFGYQVHYETFESNEELMKRMQKPDFSFDLIVPGASYAKNYIDQGNLYKLDKEKLSNYANIDANLLNKLRQIDPNNDFLIPWGWGYTTVGINKTRVSEVLGDIPIPENSWELVFNPAYTGKLKECGIVMMKSATEMIPTAMHYAGLSPYSKSEVDHLKAIEVLGAVRADIKGFSDNVIEDLGGKRACVAVGWSGDINLAAKLMKDVGEKDEIVATIPSIGGLLFIDTIAIYKGSRQSEDAYKFVNYFLRPEVAAGVTDTTNSLTGNKKANNLLDEKILKNKTVSLSEEHFSKMVPPVSLDLKTISSMEKLYNEYMDGKPEEGVKVVEVTKASSGVKPAERAKAVDSTKGSSGGKPAEGVKAVEVTKASSGVKPAEGAKAVDSTKSSSGGKPAEAKSNARDSSNRK